MTDSVTSLPTRRTVLAASAATVATASLGMRANTSGGSDVIRIGLIGCGGRGKGALNDALNADPNTVVTAVADAFASQAEVVAGELAKFGDRVRITKDRTFVGLDAYRQLVQCDDVDYVLIACPPKFHCHFLEASIDAGKHTFCEKPGASDVVGLKQLLRATAKAKAKGLGLMCGLQRRHSPSRQKVIERLREGALGELVAASAWWNRINWMYLPRRDDETDLGFQLRSWRPQHWLSADSPGSILIHQVDVINWAFDAVPDSCMCIGGRLVHTDPAIHGSMYDHFAAEFQYPGGRMMSAQVKNMPVNQATKEVVYGAKGVCHIDRGFLFNDGTHENHKPSGNDMVREHKCLLDSVRNGAPVNYGQVLADATLVTLMMTMSAYSGRLVTKEFVLEQSTWQNGPSYEDLSLDMVLPVQEVPMPGRFQLV
ncbi:MAG: Gfo/Idh/MocA family oxidoreductase [Planctomycetes bacterium]|nr:Gfo/Idh/MocA family oxidoreductase [Planctomycetota bacterium]